MPVLPPTCWSRTLDLSAVPSSEFEPKSQWRTLRLTYHRPWPVGLSASGRSGVERSGVEFVIGVGLGNLCGKCMVFISFSKGIVNFIVKRA